MSLGDNAKGDRQLAIDGQDGAVIVVSGASIIGKCYKPRAKSTQPSTTSIQYLLPSTVVGGAENGDEALPGKELVTRRDALMGSHEELETYVLITSSQKVKCPCQASTSSPSPLLPRVKLSPFSWRKRSTSSGPNWQISAPRFVLAWKPTPPTTELSLNRRL